MGREYKRMTEKTWALLIICATIILLAAIISDCIKAVKGKDNKNEIVKFEPELWAHDIPCPPTKPPKKDATVKGVLVGSKEWMEDE